MINKIKCVHCRKSNYIKKGFRQTEKRGKIQKYKCLECGKYFTNDDGFYRMRNSKKIITMSVDIYLSNLSSRKMRNQLLRHMNTEISHVSVLDWVRKYVLKVHKYVDNLMPQNLSGKYYADETMIDCKGRDDRFWACIDWGTRMIVGTHYSLSGNPQEAVTFLKKSTAKGKPMYIQTDSAGFYPKAFKKCFYSNKKRGLTVEHRANNVSKTGQHNVRIETVFSKIKDRVDDFRGLKALWSAPIMLAGLVIQHNFIEEHTITRTHPCQLAGINPTNEKNRWLNLIRLATT